MSEYVTVAKTSEVAPGTAIVVDVDDLAIALAHVEGEGFYAIDDMCSHDGGPLGDGELDGTGLECPRHGALFDVRTGEALTLPAIEPVTAYEVRVVGDDIQIKVP